LSQRKGKSGLPNPGGPFSQNRLVKAIREEHDLSDSRIGEVPNAFEVVSDR
jgi:hypothetical protein